MNSTLRLTKEEAREIVDALDAADVPESHRRAFEALGVLLDKAQAADVESGDDNTITIVVEG